jgi:hypothetical protein
MQLVDASTLAIAPRSPRSYDGVDLLVTAPLDASLIVDLSPRDGPARPAIEWPLARLAKTFQQADLDDQKNRLVGQRSPGDRLPVTIECEHLVFAPAEKLQFTVAPRPLDLAPQTSYVLSVALAHPRGGAEVASQDREFRTDGAGRADLDGNFTLTLPVEGGVYDVRLALYPKRLAPLVRGKPLAERRVQLVVVDPAQPASDPDAPWETALELDPAHPRWWEKMTRLPTLARLPLLGTQTYGNAPAGARVHLDRTLVEIAPEAWQAYPLSLAEPGRLHLLEVEYPDDLPQAMQVSVVEPNAAGLVAPVGLDTGLEVSPPPAQTKGKIRVHRVPFWPQTKSPLVLIANRSAELPAVYGRVRVKVGPDHLPPLAVVPPEGASRLLAVSLERPFLCESFGAGEALDAQSGQTRKDWVSFFAGGQRLVEYLAHTGRNAAIITLAGDGSALYPSELLTPTPQYDGGPYFESGQDPRRKDVAELLFRLFDRAGLTLVPAVKFSAPLPELELVRQHPLESVGIEPIGSDGRSYIARSGTRRGIGVHYNVLDQRVQAAMRRVVEEIAKRYGHHPSFGGVAIHLSPESYAVLPDAGYSLDDATVARFSHDTGSTVPGEGAGRYATRAAYLQGKGRAAWLEWRAVQLAAFYQGMEADVARTHAGARLFLLTGDLASSRALSLALRPMLPQPKSASAALLLAGIDPARMAGHGTMVIPRPQRLVPTVVAGSDWQAHFNQSTSLDELFGRPAGGAVLFAHEPAALRLSSFDAASPFGANRTHTWFIPSLLPAGAESRKRFVQALADGDALVLVDSGWLVPLGQDDPLASLSAVYRRLPARPFQTAQPADKEQRTQPVTIRWLAEEEKTCFYAVNDSPWPVTVEIDFEAEEIFRLTSYDPQRPGTLARQGSGATWSVNLEAYDLVGGELSSGRARVAGWRVAVPQKAETYLREQVQDARQRALALRDPPPLAALANPSFEEADMAGQISGWTTARGAGIVAELDPTQASHGAFSLHLASRPQAGLGAPDVWVRSEPIPAPQTGRLSVLAWIKIADPRRQPKLRLAVEGKLDGKSFYRRANVGAAEDGAAAKALTTTWAPYRFPLTDLPPTGVTELRVGFDLMGEGEVWIDDVQVYHLWFEDHERNELLKIIANADFQLSSGRVGDCQRFVESYWARFLRAHVPLPEGDTPLAHLEPPLAGQDNAAPTEPPRRDRRGKEKEERPSMLERMRGWWPKSMWR